MYKIPQYVRGNSTLCMAWSGLEMLMVCNLNVWIARRVVDAEMHKEKNIRFVEWSKYVYCAYLCDLSIFISSPCTWSGHQIHDYICLYLWQVTELPILLQSKLWIYDATSIINSAILLNDENITFWFMMAILCRR